MAWHEKGLGALTHPKYQWKGKWRFYLHTKTYLFFVDLSIKGLGELSFTVPTASIIHDEQFHMHLVLIMYSPLSPKTAATYYFVFHSPEAGISVKWHMQVAKSYMIRICICSLISIKTAMLALYNALQEQNKKFHFFPLNIIFYLYGVTVIL